MIEELGYEKPWSQILMLIGDFNVFRYHKHNSMTIYTLGLNRSYEIYRIKKFLFRVCFCICNNNTTQVFYYNLPYPMFLGKIL